MKTFNSICLIVAISSFTLFACKKHCDDHCLKVKKGIKLSGDQEVPPKDTDAYGSADVCYDKCAKVLKFTISWNNLTGIPTGSHIHGTAPRGVNAPIKFDYFSLIPKTTIFSVLDVSFL